MTWRQRDFSRGICLRSTCCVHHKPVESLLQAQDAHGDAGRGRSNALYLAPFSNLRLWKAEEEEEQEEEEEEE